MDEAQFVNGFDRQHTLRHVETRNVLSECVVFDEHGHEIAAREELHDQVEVHSILE